MLTGLMASMALSTCLQAPPALPDVPPTVRSLVLAAPVPDAIEQSPGGGGELALLITDPDSRWQSLRNALLDAGIPVRSTTQVASALRHRSVLVYPYLSGRVLSAEELRALAAFPREGGVLIASQVLGGGLEEVFGFRRVVEGLRPQSLSFASGLERPLKRLTIPFSLTSLAYGEAREVLARFDGGDAAIVQRRFPRGVAIALGVDLGSVAFLAHSGRDDVTPRPYVNAFVPLLDSLVHFVRQAYLGAAGALVLEPLPDAQKLAVLVTHDIDSRHAVGNLAEYAQMEHGLGVAATYFVTTKYIRDDVDAAFFDPATVSTLNSLRGLGMEIGSHSVSHSRVFSKFPVGEGPVSYPGYCPFVRDARTTLGGTVAGELLVSKYLLDQSLHQDTASFRAGHLEDPDALAQSLAASDYRFDSSTTANEHLTHLPFRMTHDSRGQATLPVIRIPVTIEDEAAPELLQRLDPAIEVCTRIADFQGVCNVLVHPNVTAGKLEFTRRFIDYWKPRAWLATVDELGRWWAARSQVELTVETSRIVIRAPERVAKLVLRTGKRLRIDRSEPPNAVLDQKDDRIFLAPVLGDVVLHLR